MIARRIPALLGALALCLLPAACGDDEDSGEAGKASVTKPTKVEISVTESGKNALLKLPKSVKAGPTELSFRNTGKKPHDAQLVRVTGGHSFADVLAVVNKEGGPTPKWLSFAGGIGTVAPGRLGTTTAVLAPGTYFVADTSSEGKEAAELEVTGGVSSSALAGTPARIEAVEYGFEPSGLRAGTNEITFDNTGAEPHHIVAAPIKEGSTIEDVKKFATTEGEAGGPPPIEESKSATTAVLDGGNKQVVQLELQRGNYALLCFVSDRQGGPPHVQRGMIQEVEVQR